MLLFCPIIVIYIILDITNTNCIHMIKIKENEYCAWFLWPICKSILQKFHWLIIFSLIDWDISHVLKLVIIASLKFNNKQSHTNHLITTILFYFQSINAYKLSNYNCTWQSSALLTNKIHKITLIIISLHLCFFKR